MSKKYTAIIQPDGTRYKAIISDLNITVYGDTYEEAMNKIEEAIVAARIQALEAAEARRAERHQVA